MTRRKPRGLRPDEVELWGRVRRTAEPLHPGREKPLAKVMEKPAKPTGPKPWRPPAFEIGEKSGSRSRAEISPSAIASAPRMDSRNFSRLKKGKLMPEARLDLHGMTIAQAHPALISFILNAHAKGLRLVLVITGKGRQREDTGPIPERVGALRHHVPQWLHNAPIGPAVLQVSEAHGRHGGSGAVYVYLKRRR